MEDQTAIEQAKLEYQRKLEQDQQRLEQIRQEKEQREQQELMLKSAAMAASTVELRQTLQQRSSGDQSSRTVT